MSLQTEDLRAAVLTGHAARPFASATARLVPPDPATVLRSSTSLQRVCAGFHQMGRVRARRSRSMQIGLFGLVALVAVGAYLLYAANQIDSAAVRMLSITAGLGAGLGAGVLGLLYRRDEVRRRAEQGERLLRALRLTCDLPAPQIDAFLADHTAEAAFFSVYHAWLQDDAVGLGLTH